ncbi:MAG: hypothetical protein EBY23_11215 [Actinobacteria bacterium]|nr:hypothetical protein [Actinomycetota bacterium]
MLVPILAQAKQCRYADPALCTTIAQRVTGCCPSSPMRCAPTTQRVLQHFLSTSTHQGAL